MRVICTKCEHNVMTLSDEYVEDNYVHAHMECNKCGNQVEIQYEVKGGKS